MTGYHALEQLAQRELELVSAGELDRLPELHAQRDALMGALPATPPESARRSLKRAAVLQSLVTQVLEEKLDAANSELRQLGRGRTAMAGYAPALDRAPLVDRAG